MAVLVDPKTGQRYEGPDANTAEAQKRFGFVTPEAYAATQQAEQLQTEHGGEKLETAAGSAQQQAAKRLSQVSALAGDVDAMGNPINTVEPVSPETVAGIVPGLGGANAPELAARQAANPISAGLGKAAADLPLYAAAGSLTGGLGSGIAEGLGAGEALAGVVGAGTANAALSTGAEAEAAHEEHRPLDVENIGKNFAFGAVLEAGGYGLAKGIGAALGAAEKPVQAAVRNTIDRAGTTLEDIRTPEEFASARAETQTKIEATANELASAAESVKPVVDNNFAAQKSEIWQIADVHSALADDLEVALRKRPANRYQALLDLRDAADSPRAQEALDGLVSDRALWGDAAVDHGNTMQAIAAARASGPEALANAARAVKDPDVQRLVGEMDAHFGDLTHLTTREALGPPLETPTGSVGSMNPDHEATLAGKAITEVQHAKPGQVAVLAQEAPAQFALTSRAAADDMNRILEASSDDFSMKAKHGQFEAHAEDWTPEHLDKQNSWYDEQAKALRITHDKLGYLPGTAGTEGRTIIENGLAKIENATGGEKMRRADLLKQSLDRLVMKMGRSRAVDLGAPEAVIKEIRPMADQMREGLQSSDIFGKAGDLQRDVNRAMSEDGAIGAWNHVLGTTTEVSGRNYGEIGINSIERRAKPETLQHVMAVPGGPGENFQADLGKSIDMWERVAKAYEEHGHAIPADVRQFEAAAQGLRDHFNYAAVLRAVENKAGSAGRSTPGINPGHAAGLVVGHFAEAGQRALTGLPLGRAPAQLFSHAGGALYKAGRALLGKGTPGLVEDESSALGRMVTGQHKSFRHLEQLKDEQFGGDYLVNAPSTKEALIKAGAARRGALAGKPGEEAFTMPGGSGSGSAGAPSGANDVMTSAPGFRQAAQPVVSRSPVSLAGMTLKDLGALPFDEVTDRASTLRGLRESPEFSASGRAPKAFDRAGHEQGITISVDPEDGSLHLIDGRHRFSVAREKDLSSIWGTVREAGSGKVLFRGDIPMKGAPEASQGAKRIREILARRGAQEGSADFSFLQPAPEATAKKLLESGGDPLAEKLAGGGGTSTEGGFYRGSDGVERYAKFHVEPQMALNEAATAAVYRDFGVRVPSLEAVTRKTGSVADAAAEGWGDLAAEPNNQKVLLSERLPDDWKPIDKFSAAQVTPEAAREYVRGVPADIVLGNWDLWQNPNPGNLFSNGSGVMRLDVGEAGPRVLGPPGLFGMSKPVDKELMWEKFARSVEQHPATFINNPGQLPSSSLGSSKLADVKTELMEGVLRIKTAIAKAGGPEKFVASHYPHLPADQQQYFAEAIESRVRFVQRHVDKIAAIAIGAGLTFGFGGQASAATPMPAPAPQYAPEPPQGADDQHAQYLQQAGARDTTATARAMTDPVAAQEFARRSQGQPSTLELFQGDHATLQQAFTAQRAKVEQIMRDPSSVIDSLADAFGGLSPALRDQLAAKAMVIATYLHAQLPPQRGVSMMRPNGLPPAPLEARSYALKYMTATQPTTAFDDAKRGQLRHEQVDTLQATWPEQYDDLKQQTLTELGAGKSTIVQRQRADLLFGFQTALDPAFSSRLSTAAVQARQAKPQNPSVGAGGAPAKSRTTTALQPGGLAALSA